MTLGSPKITSSPTEGLSSSLAPQATPGSIATPELSLEPAPDPELTAEQIAMIDDANRVTDLDRLIGLIGLYLIESSDPGWVGDLATGNNKCVDEGENIIYISLPSMEALPPPPSGWKWKVSPSPSRIDGTGWIPIDFTKMRGGSPYAELPVDPINRADLPRGKRLFYAYVCRQRDWKFVLNANLASESWSRGGDKDSESTDGGKWPYAFELGELSLSPGIESDIYYLP